MTVVLSTVICFFAVFGFIQMILNIKHALLQRGAADKITIVVTFKNEQDTAEGALRDIVWSCMHGVGGTTIPQIIAVDLGSEDETPTILRKLSDKYGFIRVTDKEQYIKIMEQGF